MKRLPPLAHVNMRCPLPDRRVYTPRRGQRMRKIRDVLRLSAEGLSTRQIAASLAIGRTTLRGYLERADKLGLSWPLPPGLSDTDLERQIYPRTARDVSNRATQPDWAHVHRELRHKGVTLSL